MPASAPSSLDLALPLLRCPVCAAGLGREGASLRCPADHTFDIARQGYVSLLTGAAPTSGDDGPMTRARRDFLATGRYDPIRDAIAVLAARPAPPPSTVLDVGCGTGYHLAGVLDALPAAHGLGLDSSAHALRAAARAHPRGAAAAWDAFRPFPIAPTSVDLVLNVFAPRNGAEFQRVLRPNGRLIVARPDHGHLAQLRHAVAGMIDIDPEKEERLHRALDPHFETVETKRVAYTAALTREQAVDLVSMTPSARHLTAEDLHRDAKTALPDEVDVSILVSAYRPR